VEEGEIHSKFCKFCKFQTSGQAPSLGSDAPATIVIFLALPPYTKYDTQITRYLVDNDIILIQISCSTLITVNT
jgi:hypothetical protein